MSSKQWSELPIQNDPFDTSETIYLAFGNNFRYEPTANGTKHISIVNGRGIVNPTKFRLEIIDGGEFSIDWASNIQWKTGTAPQFQQYHTDVLMFETSDNGQTWIGEVTQTTAMTPYWKISVMPRNTSDTSLPYSYNPIEVFLPINSDAIESIDWGDGTVDEYPFISSQLKDINNITFNKHQYPYTSLYTITIKSTKFNTGYIATYHDEYNDDFKSLRIDVVQIVNPLPALKGSYQKTPETMTETDYVLNDVLRAYTNITSIPDTFFANNSSYPIGAQCFSGCSSLQTIPPNPFVNDSAATDFSKCFYECSSLVSIPAGLFNSCTAATTFENCFYGCTSLKAIPQGLFDNQTLATDFKYCFYYCSSLASIPAGLFDSCTAATTFYYCFYKCSSIQSIPSGLFDNCTAAVNFAACFRYCSSLTNIPDGLFDNCINATHFGGGRNSYSEGCFQNCTSLQSIPSNLFKKNVNIQYIDQCFDTCNALNDFNVHIGSSLVSNCNYFVSEKSNTTRTVYVPSGSTTQTKFNAVASSLGLTIIGE